MSIYINSRDRPVNQNADKANYTANIREDGIKQIGLASYDFITQFSNINSISAVSYIETSTQTIPVAIPYGFYDATDLAAAITAQLVAFPGGAITCTWSGVRFSFNSVVPIRFIYNPVLVGVKSWSIMCGVNHGAPLATIINGGVVDLAYTNALFVLSNSVCRRKIKGDYGTNQNITNVLGVVYLYDGRLIDDVIKDPIHATADLSAIKYINYDPRDPVSQVDIEILDERGNILPDELKNQFTYMMELRYN